MLTFLKVGLGILLGVGLTGIVTLVTGEHTTMYSSGYKQGQIDYYNGKVKYVLKVQDDGSIVWVKHETE